MFFEQAFISHNNISESCIYLNTKQVWKINDFELALNFADLNRDNLRAIYEFKSKNAVTPEEELAILIASSTNVLASNKNKYDLDVIYKEHPHSIDAYAWAMLVFNLISARRTTKQPNGANGTSETTGKNNATFYQIEHKESTTSITSIIDNEENDDRYCLEELEKFLNKDPAQRPTLSYALNMSLFELYNNSLSNSMNSSFNEYVGNNLNEVATSGESAAASHFDPFKIDDLDKLEAQWPRLVSYLTNLTQSSEQNQTSEASPAKTLLKKSRDHMLNEKLVDFLLSPFMFFSEKVTKFIFPSVFIPKGELKINDKSRFDYLKVFMLSNSTTSHFNLVNNEDGVSGEENHSHLEPFMDVDKYKVFVLPRILNLFSMHSTQIRLVLLEYFPFYITFVNDLDTLKYEILPEVILSLCVRPLIAFFLI